MVYRRVSARRLISEEVLLLCAAALAFLVLLLICEVDSWALRAGFWIVVIVVLLVGGVYLPLLWHAAGWRLTSRALYYRHGVLFRSQSVMLRSQVISVVLVQTPLSPILRIASVTVRSPGASISVRGLSLSQAKRLVQTLSPRNEL